MFWDIDEKFVIKKRSKKKEGVIIFLIKSVQFILLFFLTFAFFFRQKKGQTSFINNLKNKKNPLMDCCYLKVYIRFNCVWK
ncbi:MAG: hypothetical protein DF280_01470 ['Brassica napus' phytoplasma]|nr:MAG: hypothetical protein DF280_01470 ['Brassica napus' phytoplasma]